MHQHDLILTQIAEGFHHTYGPEFISEFQIFMEMWGELVRTLISWGCSAQEIISDIEGIEDACDRVGMTEKDFL